jgi:hypothetical protein
MLENLIDAIGERNDWWIEASYITYFSSFKGLSNKGLKFQMTK